MVTDAAPISHQAESCNLPESMLIERTSITVVIPTRKLVIVVNLALAVSKSANSGLNQVHMAPLLKRRRGFPEEA